MRKNGYIWEQTKSKLSTWDLRVEGNVKAVFVREQCGIISTLLTYWLELKQERAWQLSSIYLQMGLLHAHMIFNNDNIEDFKYFFYTVLHFVFVVEFKYEFRTP